MRAQKVAKRYPYNLKNKPKKIKYKNQLTVYLSKKGKDDLDLTLNALYIVIYLINFLNFKRPTNTKFQKLQKLQSKLTVKLGRRIHSSPLPIIFTKTFVIVILLILMSTDSMYTILDLLILLVGAPILIYFILFGYKYLV